MIPQIEYIEYRIEVIQLKKGVDKEKYSDFRYDLGYLVLLWRNQFDAMMNWYGLITSEEIKQKIGVEQWREFCNGKREFIIERNHE